MLSSQEPYDARAHELGDGTDESEGLVGDNSRVISHSQSTVMNPQKMTDVMRHQSVIAQNALDGGDLAGKKYLLLQHYQRLRGGAHGARTPYQGMALTPNAQTNTENMSFSNLGPADYSMAGLGRAPLNVSHMSNRAQNKNDRISVSIRNQMQMQLEYAEAQEEEFRQMIRLKRKRIETHQEQRPSAKIGGVDTKTNAREAR